jgi:hypothetical protein
MRRLTVLASVLVFAATFGSSVLAQQGKGKGKGGNQNTGTSTTFTLVLVNDVNGNGSPDWGDTVTFSVSTTETNQPYVSLTCYQGGALVASSDTWPDPTTLFSRTWQSGAAECTAELFYFRSPSKVVIATLPFSVGA